MNSSSNVWQKFRIWLSNNTPGLLDYLNLGAGQIELDKMRNFGIAPTDQLYLTYSENNGCSKPCGLFFGFEFIDLSYSFEITDRLVEGYEKNAELGYPAQEISLSIPQFSIKNQGMSKKWLPIMHDNAGNYIGVDLDPDVGGTVGQIIYFGRDMKHVVVEESWEKFLGRYLHLCELGVLKLFDDEDFPIISVSNQDFDIIQFLENNKLEFLENNR